MKITPEKFENATGFKPEGDDLDRCNCSLAGTPGHFGCGWDKEKNLPVYMVLGGNPSTKARV